MFKIQSKYFMRKQLFKLFKACSQLLGRQSPAEDSL